MSSTSPTTVLLNASVFADTDSFEVCNINTGLVTIIPGSGFQLDLVGGANQLNLQYAAASVRYRGAGEAVLNGDLVPSVTLVQPNAFGFNASTGTVAATLGSAVLSTSSLIAVVQVYTPTSNSAGAITDTNTGTWTNVRVSSDALTTQHQWFICNNPGAGTHTATWTGAPSGGGSQIVLMEFSGGPFTLDNVTTNAFSSGTSGGTPGLGLNRSPEIVHRLGVGRRHQLDHERPQQRLHGTVNRDRPFEQPLCLPAPRGRHRVVFVDRVPG